MISTVRHTLSITLTAGAAVATIFACYAWLDSPVAWFIHDHVLRQYGWLDTLTHIPDLLVYGSAILLLFAPLRLVYRGNLARVEQILLAMSTSLAVAVLLKDTLKFVFGRTWPETWVQNNPSLIHDHVYGFFWFQSGAGFHSFPSGHATVTFAIMSVLWLSSPNLRWLAALGCTLVAVGLLGMNYHFLGDILAGALLGSLCGFSVWQIWQGRARNSANQDTSASTNSTGRMD